MMTLPELQTARAKAQELRQAFGGTAGKAQEMSLTLALDNDNPNRLQLIKVAIASLEHDLEHLDDDIDEAIDQIQAP